PNREYHYNQAGRLSEVLENGLLEARYTYNAEGQRTRKVLFSGGTLPTGTTFYHYDLGGQLLAETREDGTPLRDYLWHDDEPLAQIDTAGGFETLRYLHTDHLKTPRACHGHERCYPLALGRGGLREHGARASERNRQPEIPGAVLRCGDGAALQLLPGL
ncbi:MAG: hypothetical protein ACREXU_11215, partial [Gammaproteobacteria bacterium]